MAIWRYGYRNTKDEITDQIKDRYISSCIYCKSHLTTLSSTRKSQEHSGYLKPVYETSLKTCPICGWWVQTFTDEIVDTTQGRIRSALNGNAWWVYRSWGVLRNLDIDDISIPLHELRSHLLVKYMDRFQINPTAFEDVVGGVFKDFGYQARVIGGAGDKGIDVILVVLDGQRNTTIGVQVKRYRNTIEAELIRSFGGALVLQGMTRGIFVTTSDFSRGAKQTACDWAKHGIFVELCDSKSFYEKLHFTTSKPYKTATDPHAPWSLSKEPDLLVDFYINPGADRLLETQLY